MYNDINNSLNKNNMYKSALDSSSDGILISDNKGNVIYINHAYEITTGLKKEFMLDKNLKDLLEQKIFNNSVSLLVIQNKSPTSIIHKYITGKTALTTANPILSEDGNLIGVISNTRNISELINLKEELEKTKNLTKKYSDELFQLRKEQLKINGLIYKSKAMEDTLQFAGKVAPFDSTVLITGKSGTGKEMLAKFIHNESNRKNEPFIKVNCAAIPKELFESELFGYMGGSFTGASKDGKPGMFELANNGTILLDEIGELPLYIQPKLLRVIQEKEVYRIGGKTPINLDVRVLAATNRDLKSDVKEGKFREDLFFRLNVVPINVPPLKERKEDICEMALYFMKRLNKKYKKNITLPQKVIDALENYSWPGNVRELENMVEYLFIVNHSNQIDIELLPSWILTEHIMKIHIDETDNSTPRLNYMLNMYEKNIITIALSKSKSVRETSKVLDIHPSTLFRKIKKYNIDLRSIDII